MRALLQTVLTLLLAAAYVPAAAWGPPGPAKAAAGATAVRPSPACCGPGDGCSHRGACASAEPCAAVSHSDPSGAEAPADAAGHPGRAKLCAARCGSDPARVIPGDPDPWVLQTASGVRPSSPLDQVTAAVEDPIARTFLPAVPPPRA